MTTEEAPPCRYYVKDHLVLVRALVDGAVNAVGTRDYYPFGLPLPGRYDEGSPPTREDYTGHERDAATQLHYAGARYYLSAFGRWMATDPLAYKNNSDSPYTYVVNNPINYVDLAGLDTTATTHSGDEVTVEGEGQGLPSDPTGIVVTAERRDSNGGGSNSILSTASYLTSSAGTAAGLVERGLVRESGWLARTQGGYRRYSLSWPGNQYVSREAVLSRAIWAKRLGRGAFAVGSVISASQALTYYGRGGTGIGTGMKAATDIGVGYVGAFSGLAGVVFSAAYFSADALIMFSNTATFHYMQARGFVRPSPTVPVSTSVGISLPLDGKTR